MAPVQTEPISIPIGGSLGVAQPVQQKAARFRIGLVGVLVVWQLVVVLSFLLMRSRARVPEHATIVIGEITNKTGDPVFDGTLRRAVVIQLAQSPYLRILPDQKLGEILQGIGKSPDEVLTPGLARQVCQHGQAAALITGSIQVSDGSYTLTMVADRCSDNVSLAQESITTDSRQQVLAQLGKLMIDFRRKLGESRESLQKYDVPIEEATTSSLDALKAYQLGLELRGHSKNLESRPVFKTAIALDPNFAIAYAQLGSAYSNLGNTAAAKQYFQKAFELRARATEPERLYITGRYFDIVTGELEKGSATYKLWTELYPNEWKPYNAVANDAYLMGRYDTVVEFSRKAIQLGPDQDFGFSNLLSGLIALNRLDEAKKLCDRLLAEGRDNSFIHLSLFAIGYLEQDATAVQHEIEWGQQHSSDGSIAYAQAQAAAAEGRIKQSTRLFEEVAKIEMAQEDQESAANALSISAELNSELGRNSIAREISDRALKLGKNEIVLGLGAMIAIRAHDNLKAQRLLEEMDHDYPISTFNIGVYSPMIHTATALMHGGSAAEVTSLMETAVPYEYGAVADMLPIYVRGVSYETRHAPVEAQTEFQKIIDHRSVDAVTMLYPLAWLGRARCYAAQGKKEESRDAYRELFEIWKEADKDLPLLAQAHKEFNALDGVPAGKMHHHL